MALGLEQGTYKISLEHPAVPLSKEVLRKQNDGGILKEHRSQMKEPPSMHKVRVIWTTKSRV